MLAGIAEFKFLHSWVHEFVVGENIIYIFMKAKNVNNFLCRLIYFSTKYTIFQYFTFHINNIMIISTYVSTYFLFSKSEDSGSSRHYSSPIWNSLWSQMCSHGGSTSYNPLVKKWPNGNLIYKTTTCHFHKNILY